ncbi:Glycoside hydrolase family 38, central domain [Dillenia turbinata]|uniref:Glycoside hydrolase family 38, central domain n=1 Tax=Dillenia turbinata TaxID=194707 RepID=A0AAN8V9F7_9MAGN
MTLFCEHQLQLSRFADTPNAYWTGFFTSHPALKRYVRMLSGFYLAKQFHICLGDVLGISQHHDAVNGTAKQHTTNDFVKRLAIGTQPYGASSIQIQVIHVRQTTSAFKQLCFDFVYFARIEYQDRTEGKDDKTLNIIWGDGKLLIITNAFQFLVKLVDEILMKWAFFHSWWTTQCANSKYGEVPCRCWYLEFVYEMVAGVCMKKQPLDQMRSQFNKVPLSGWDLFSTLCSAGLLGAEPGIDSRAKHKDDETLEVIRQRPKTFGFPAQIFTNAFPVHYGPPPASTSAMINLLDNLLFNYNVEQRANGFIDAAVSHPKTNHIMWTMDDDFQYQYAESWFKQMDKLIHYVNKPHDAIAVTAKQHTTNDWAKHLAIGSSEDSRWNDTHLMHIFCSINRLVCLELDFDSEHFARIDYQDRAKRKDDKTLDFIWQGSKTFSFLCLANVTRTNHIMWTMGDNCQYQYAESWFKQMDKLIHYVNKVVVEYNSLGWNRTDVVTIQAVMRTSHVNLHFARLLPHTGASRTSNSTILLKKSVGDANLSFRSAFL